MINFEKEVEEYNYFVFKSDNTCNVYKSLRAISNDINVDYSTISKKIKKNGDTTSCVVAPKNAPNTYYYIVKFKENGFK